MERNNKKHVLRWKVDDETYQRFQKIVSDGGFTTAYELCQYIFSAFMRIADPSTEMTAGLEELKDLWHDWQEPESHFNSVNGTKSLKMRAAMYVFANRRGRTVACELISEQGGVRTVSHSSKELLAYVLTELFPLQAERLRRIGTEIDEASFIRVIDYLSEEYTPMKRGDYAMNGYGLVPKQRMRTQSVNEQ